MTMSQDLSHSGKSFSFRHAICSQHSQNYIVNFCTNPECLKPMCSECIKVHAKEHASKGTHGSFETIEEISEKSHQEILKVRQIYKEQQYRIYNYQQKLDNQEFILKEKLKIARDKIQQKIDNYFTQIEKDLIEQSKRQKTKQSSDLNLLIRKINENEEELNQMHQKMPTPEFTNQVVSFLNQPHEKTAIKIGNELEKMFEILGKQLLDVMFDEMKIDQVDKTLKGYIKLENQEYYPDIGSAKVSQIIEKKSPITSQVPKKESLILQQQQQQFERTELKPENEQKIQKEKKGHFLQKSTYFQVPKGHNSRNYSIQSMIQQPQQQYIQNQNVQMPMMSYAPPKSQIFQPSYQSYSQFQPNRSVFY